jgi:hypothetical protein
LLDTFDTIWLPLSRLTANKDNIKLLLSFEKSLIHAMKFWGDKFEDHTIASVQVHHKLKKLFRTLPS